MDWVASWHKIRSFTVLRHVIIFSLGARVVDVHVARTTISLAFRSIKIAHLTPCLGFFDSRWHILTRSVSAHQTRHSHRVNGSFTFLLHVIYLIPSFPAFASVFRLFWPQNVMLTDRHPSNPCTDAIASKVHYHRDVNEPTRKQSAVSTSTIGCEVSQLMTSVKIFRYPLPSALFNEAATHFQAKLLISSILKRPCDDVALQDNPLSWSRCGLVYIGLIYAPKSSSSIISKDNITLVPCKLSIETEMLPVALNKPIFLGILWPK